MLENYSRQALQLIEDAKNLASARDEELVGSEHLLLAMAQMPDSVCHFLLAENNMATDKLTALLEESFILRKKSHLDLTYTEKFQQIILQGKEVAKMMESEFVYEEHLFYSLLQEKECVAYDVLKRLGLSIAQLLEDIWDLFSNVNSEKVSFPFLTNLTVQTKAHHYVKRSNHVERIKVIMNKKQKNNPLLIGNAGVGKTAIVEGFADAIKPEIVYCLDLGGIVSNTKYRGELEDKLIKAMDFIKREKAILFIDEIHNIVGAGSNDGTLDVANILKPYLARSDIRCIGATTLEEYYQYIYPDKALMRRFQNIFVDEPTANETKTILMSIKKCYEEYHQIEYSENDIDIIIASCEKYLPERAFPDKAIDVMDEVGARSDAKQLLNANIITEVIQEMSGIKAVPLKQLKQLELNYPALKPYALRFIDGTYSYYSHLISISCDQSLQIEWLLADFNQLFGLKQEMFLKINLENYYDITSINNLIGATKGYVGYETGGILSEHLIKYPMAVVYFTNLKHACPSVKQFIQEILQEDHLIDHKGRKISLKKVIFIVENENEKASSLGLINRVASDSPMYDLCLYTEKRIFPKKQVLALKSLIHKYQLNEAIFDFSLPERVLEQQIYELILK